MKWTNEILSFWFKELDPKDWWTKCEAMDTICYARFSELWDEEKLKVAADFLTSAKTALAAVILFDQIPRNMYRDSVKAYATDYLAQKIAEKAVNLELDRHLSEEQRVFLYMPFMHAEDMRLQKKSVALFNRLGRHQEYAREHRDVIAKFGRFPHRNEILGRTFLPGEQEAIDDGAIW